MTSQQDGGVVAPPAPDDPDEALGESRWWPAAALLVYMGLNIALRVWLPDGSAVRVPWLLPALEGVLLVVLLGADPQSIARRSLVLRRVAMTLVVLLVCAALWSTILLIYDLVQGLGVSEKPGELLATGGLVWLGNNLTFALLLWLMDSGGPVARLRHRTAIDFAFTQHMSPELAPAGWRPVFLDYLHLGFTNATAFSPTDVMPLTRWAKFAMMIESSLSLMLAVLVIARAVNILD